MTTYTYESEKQVLKLYIRLLLYVNDKYSENESSKIDPNSLLGYLHSLKEETLLQQVLKNKLRNNEMYNDGQALDVSFYDLYNEDIDSAEPLAPAFTPVEAPAEALDTDPYSEQYRPPFPNLAAMTGKEPILSPEQRKMVNTIKTNPTLSGVYDYLLANAKDIQLKFIEAALPMFIDNKWDEKTKFDRSANETLIQLIAKLVNEEEERKRTLLARPLIAQTQYEDEDEEELAQAVAPVIAQEPLAPEALAPRQQKRVSFAQPTALETEQFIPPFTESTEIAGKELILTPEQKKMVNTIKTNADLDQVKVVLATQSIDVQSQFIEAAWTIFHTNKWDEKTPININIVKTLLQLITNISAQEEARKLTLLASTSAASALSAPAQAQAQLQVAQAQVAQAQAEAQAQAQAEAQVQAQAQAPLVQEQRQTNRIALMADKNPMQKFKILIGPQVINNLRLTKDDDFKKWYTNSKNKNNLIFSLNALIEALNINMKTGESFTKILDKSTAEIPNYIKSTVAKLAIQVLLSISSIKTIVTNVKSNILEIYDYPNGINDFIQDLTEVVADLTTINNSVKKK